MLPTALRLTICIYQHHIRPFFVHNFCLIILYPVEHCHHASVKALLLEMAPFDTAIARSSLTWTRCHDNWLWITFRSLVRNERASVRLYVAVGNVHGDITPVRRGPQLPIEACGLYIAISLVRGSIAGGPSMAWLT
jgi:hypothetical protein